MKNLALSGVVLLTILTIGCGQGTLEEKRITNVVKVFWHENDRYSLLIKKPESSQLNIVELPPYLCKNSLGIRLLQDVSKDIPMWVHYEIKHGSFDNQNPCIVKLDIHIRSENDIEGGGWNHGKFGHGQTTVIQ